MSRARWMPSTPFLHRRGAGCSRSGYETFTFALDEAVVESESGLRLVPTCLASEALPIDTLVIPGGCALRDPEIGARVGAWIGANLQHFRRVAAVCTGAFALSASQGPGRAAGHDPWALCARARSALSEASAAAGRHLPQGRSLLHFGRDHCRHRPRSGADRGGLWAECGTPGRARTRRLPAAAGWPGPVLAALADAGECARSAGGCGCTAMIATNLHGDLSVETLAEQAHLSRAAPSSRAASSSLLAWHLLPSSRPPASKRLGA